MRFFAFVAALAAASTAAASPAGVSPAESLQSRNLAFVRRACDCDGVTNCCINDCGLDENCCNTTCIDRFPDCVNAC